MRRNDKTVDARMTGGKAKGFHLELFDPRVSRMRRRKDRKREVFNSGLVK